jgi:hypothetical protein
MVTALSVMSHGLLVKPFREGRVLDTVHRLIDNKALSA